MNPISVAIIVGIIFVILTMIIDGILYSQYGCTCGDLNLSNQYMITFGLVFFFSLFVEYFELNDWTCSGNH